MKINRKNYTILSPEMGAVQTEIYKRIFELEDYNIKVLKATSSAVEVGNRYVNNDACYPSIIIIGVLIEELLTSKYHKDNVAVIISQTEGLCRGSNYLALLKIALKKIGYENIPIIPLGFFNFEKSRILKMTNKLLVKLAMGTVLSDLINKLFLKTFAYEKEIGTGERLKEKYLSEVDTILKGINISRFKKFILRMIKEFDSVELMDINKPKVGIVGEVFLKYNTFGNYNLHEDLHKEGVELILPDMYTFVQFMLSHTSITYRAFKKYRIMATVHNVEIKVISLFSNIVNKELKKYSKYYIPYDIKKLHEVVSEVVSDCNLAGEGWYLPAKILEFSNQGVNNIVCVQPFGCLPNHILGRGTIKRIREINEKVNFLALDYDPNLSRSNILNRIILFSSVAKDNIKKETKEL